MKNIVLLNGSPHEHGCTAALADAVEAAARPSGAKVTRYFLNDLNIRGCQGCFSCAETARCVQNDDMQPIYDDIRVCDGLVLASPVYMWSMSSQLKTAVDRLFAFLRPGRGTALKPGIKVLLLFTQGQQDTGMFRHYFEHVGKNMQFMGFGDYKILAAGGTHLPAQVLSQPEVLAEAEQLGRWLTEA
jgi:multimeric flavodoxin WrbA